MALSSSSVSFSLPTSSSDVASAPNWWWDKLSKDDGDDESAGGIFSVKEVQKDAVVFLIDSTKGMFMKTESGANPWKQLIDVCENVHRDKVISSRSDLIGVCFYGTREQKNNQGFENIYVYHSLEEPSARKIKEVHQLADVDDFKKTIGSIDEREVKEPNFCNALWAAQSMFSESNTAKFGTKRIFIFTGNDNPNASDPDIQQQAQMKAQDLDQIDVEIELFPVGSASTNFDVMKYFHKIKTFSMDEESGLPDFRPQDTVEELNEKVRRKEFKKRALASVPWTIGPGVWIAVRMYALLRTATKEIPAWLDAKTNEPLSTVTTWVCQDTGSILEDYQIKTFHPYGGEKVWFDKDDMKEIKTFDQPGLVLMGFKPIDKMKPYYNLKPPYFLYPDEAKIKGSNVAFNALLMKMTEMKKFAICRFIFREGSIPRFVALVAQEEVLDEVGAQLQPAGFNVIFLPYADDIRKPNLPPQPIADDEMIDKAKNIVKRINLKQFDPSSFDNPSLQKHYKILEALALDDDLPPDEEHKDVLQPDIQGMETVCKKEMEEFSEVHGGKIAQIEAEKPPAPAKRGRGAGGARGGASKKPKPDLSDLNMEEYAKSSKIKSLKVTVLKEFLESVGLPKAGKKAVLIERINKHFGIE